MYVRQISRKRNDGSAVTYLQLAHKVRDPETGVPRDEVLCHLGRADEIDREQVKRLVRSLSRFLDADDRTAVDFGVETGRDLGGIEATKSLAYGGSYLLDGVWQRLGIDKTLSKLLAQRDHQVDMERLVFAMVANRALEPRSKLGLEEWVGRRAHIEGLDGVASQNLYRAMDFLVEHDEEVQRRVYFAVATLLSLEVDLLFFDTTSTYCEVEEEDEEGLRRFGHSKDHRSDRPQVVIGLAVTRGGTPVRCWVVPGNTNDASMVEKVQRDLAGWRLNRVIWVMDRGMTGDAQRVALQRGGGHVIMGERLRGAEALNHAALDRAGRYKVVRDNLEVKEVTVREGSEERRFVVVRNPHEADRDRHKRERLVARLEEELKQLNKSVRTRRGKHSKAVCALKTHPTYGRYLRELKSGELRLDRAALNEESKLDGKSLLSTTDPGLSPEDVALGYKQLIDVERAFRTMKSTLDLRPLFHRLDDRIRAHVLLCWLGLLLVRVVETETGTSWPRLRDEMEQIHLVELRSKDGTAEVVTNLTAEHHTALKKLGLSAPKRLRKTALQAQSL